MGLDAPTLENIPHMTNKMHKSRVAGRGSLTLCAMGFAMLSCTVTAEAAKATKTAKTVKPSKESAVSSDTAPTLSPATDVNQEVSAFQLAGYRENGQKKWEIEGEAANIMEDTVRMTNIVAHAYGPQTNVRLTADHGTLDRKTQDVHLEDHVFATTDDGAKMRTHELDWHQADEKVTTPAKVWVARENIEVTGTGAVAHPNLKHVELEKDVTLVMTPKTDDANSQGKEKKATADPFAGWGSTPSGKAPADRKTTITCSGPLEVDYDRNVATFHDDVHVVDGRGEIFSDALTVYVDPKTKQIQKAIAQRNVRIVRGDNTAYCNEAIYDPTIGQVTLLGAPKLVIQPTEDESKTFSTPSVGTATPPEAQASRATP